MFSEYSVHIYILVFTRTLQKYASISSNKLFLEGICFVAPEYSKTPGTLHVFKFLLKKPMNDDTFTSLVVPYAILGKQLFWTNRYIGNGSIISKTSFEVHSDTKVHMYI